MVQLVLPWAQVPAVPPTGVAVVHEAAHADHQTNTKHAVRTRQMLQGNMQSARTEGDTTSFHRDRDSDQGHLEPRTQEAQSSA